MICLPMQKTQEMQVVSLGWEDALEKERATHSSILAWENPWTEEPGGLQSMGVPKSQTQLIIYTHTHTHTHTQATTSISIHEVWFVDKRTQRAKDISPSPKAQELGALLFKGKKK